MTWTKVPLNWYHIPKLKELEYTHGVIEKIGIEKDSAKSIIEITPFKSQKEADLYLKDHPNADGYLEFEYFIYEELYDDIFLKAYMKLPDSFPNG